MHRFAHVASRFLGRLPVGDVICISSILLLGLLTQTWFQQNTLIMGGDFNFRITPRDEFLQTFSIWQGARGGVGSPVFDIAELFPYRTILVIVDWLGGTPATGERAVFYYLLTASGLSAYYLGRVLFRNKGRYIGSVACALFYMFNTYAIFFKWIDRLMSLFTYCLAPLLLALFIQMQDADTWRKKARYLVFLTLVSACMAATQPAYFLLAVVPLALFSFYYVFKESGKTARIRVVLSSVLTVGLMFLVNVWWIVPLFSVFEDTQTETISYKRSLNNLNNTLVLNSQQTSFLNVFRLLGYWAIESDYKGEPYFLNRERYSTAPYIVSSFCIPLLVFSVLLGKRFSQRGLLLGFLIIAITSLFLIKGLHPPGAQIFNWLYQHIPLFILFESQYEKLGIFLALSYAVLIGLAVSRLSGLVSKGGLWGQSAFFAVLAGVLFVYIPFQFWNGQVIAPTRGRYLKSAHITVPNYYYDAAKWFRAQPDDFRIVQMPLALARDYYWSNNFSPNTFSLLYGKTLLSFPYTLNSDYATSLSNLVSGEEFFNILGLFNIKYIQLENDFDSEVRDGMTVQASKLKLSESPNVLYVRTFGKLDIYELDNSVPHIYTPKLLLNCTTCPESVGKVISEVKDKSQIALIFTGDIQPQQKDSIEHTFAGSSNIILDAPNINSERVNDAHYRISIQQAKKPFLLVFSEAYRPLWKAYIVDPKKRNILAGAPFETWFLKPLSDRSHWTINGYANGWWVNQTGDYEIILEYWSQRLIWPSLFVSTLAIVGCFGSLIVLGATWRRNRRSRRFGFR